MISLPEPISPDLLDVVQRSARGPFSCRSMLLIVPAENNPENRLEDLGKVSRRRLVEIR